MQNVELVSIFSQKIDSLAPVFKIYSHQKKFRQINYLVISLVKPLFSRNFCQKSVSKFP